jgi:hypothetical protein
MNDALDNFCSGSYGARRFALDSERVDRRGVRACPQTDRIFNTDRSVLFLRCLAYQDQPHSVGRLGEVARTVAFRDQAKLKAKGQRFVP